MAEQAVSPMMQQYFEIKKQHPNEILFYRVGDFYEMFYDDALTASRELELTLTGKNCGKEERAPMCGVPFHSYETYMARLVAKGYKVAICEQMEDPALAKGLVKRDIIRVVTPGTVIESSMLSEDKNNYLASIYCKRTRGRWRAGVCFADVSTGEAYATELNAEKIGGAIITELCRYMPSEILICPPMLDFKDVTTYIKQHTNALVELREDSCFKDAPAGQTAAAIAVHPQRSPHPGQQLTGAEGLGDIVVGTKVEGLDLILLGGAGRQDDDGGQILLPDGAYGVQTVPVGQAEVQDDEVRVIGDEHGHAHHAGLGHQRLIADDILLLVTLDYLVGVPNFPTSLVNLIYKVHGRHENCPPQIIYLYCIFIIPFLFIFVKNFFISN